jgi:amidohydrolase
MDLKQKVSESVEKLAPELIALSHEIHDHPEIGLQEHQAVAWQKEILEKYGFTFESPFCGMDTAYRAIRGTLGKGPQIGILAEYDALKGLGHGCGHNVICASSVGAAIALSQALEGEKAAVILFGTPAEETVGGKIPMADARVFDHLDCAMMMHPTAEENLVGVGSLAVTDIYVDFTGKPAHSSKPSNGINALTSAIALFNAVNAQLHLWPNKSKINGIITEGGTAPNIIPGFCHCEFSMRAEKMSQLLPMYDDFERLAKAAAAMTGAQLKISHSPFCAERYMNRPLDEAFKANMERLGEPMKWPDPNRMTGSSDIGAVSLRTPSIHAYLSLHAPGVNGHTPELCAAAATKRADQVVLLAAKGLAMTGVDVFQSEELRKAMREDFEKNAVPNRC